MTVTIEALEAKQTELSLLIAQFKAEALKPVLFVLHEAAIELQLGERYVAPVLNESGNVTHHLVLMAQRPEKKLNWQSAIDWAESIGGSIPTRQELSLLFANCKPHLEPGWHFSSETHEDDASYAWVCYFHDGGILDNHKSVEGSAVAVRRV